MNVIAMNLSDVQREAIGQELVEVSGRLIGAVLLAAGSPLEQELRSLKEDIFDVERRVRSGQ